MSIRVVEPGHRVGIAAQNAKIYHRCKVRTRVDDWEKKSLETLPSTSMTLIERLKAHQAQAWHEAVTLYGPLVYRWCRHKGLQRADAADVTQEVFRCLAQQIDRFQTDDPHSTFRGWLWTITSWRLADYQRRAVREPGAVGGSSMRQLLAHMPDPREPPEAPSGASHHLLAVQLVERARDEFSPQVWRAFWRTTIDGLRAAEVAEELGCSTSAVYMAKSRVLARLRELAADFM